MLFTGLGIIVGSAGLGWVDYSSLDVGLVGALAEATLLLVLFTDAIRIDIHRLRKHADLPARLLGLALPVTLLAGTAVAYLMFDSLTLAGSFVLAAILTPTDAALGKQVVTSPDVPIRIRQTINVESGLNDGIMLPVVTAGVIVLADEAGVSESSFVNLLIREIGLGVLIGGLVGWLGGKLLDRFANREMVDGVMRQLGTLAVGVGAFAIAEVAGGNGFVAAFVAGLGFGVAAREHCQGAHDFATDEGELLTLVTFFLFGAIVVNQAVGSFTWLTLVYALISLTVIRMIPVALSLIGSGLKRQSLLFIGWFGPRGLASILFGVFLLEEIEASVADPIFNVVIWTVLLSIVAHGVTAWPISKRYGRWYESNAKAEAEMAESMEMFDFPTR